MKAMSDVEDLVKKLRNPYEEPADLEAANAIEAQAAELTRLRAKLDRAKEAVEPVAAEYRRTHMIMPSLSQGDVRISLSLSVDVLRVADAVLSELSADTPAQPPQISDDVRSLLDEAIAALVRAEPVVSAFTFKNPKWKPWQGDWQDPRGGHAALEEIRATLTKLRAARNG
jgi:hypothetical protein